MPRRAKQLTALDVKRVVHPGGHCRNVWIAAGGVSGLQLQITPANSKSWLLRTVIGGRRRALGLGAYPEVGLADARDAARTAKARIAAGFDPIEERRAARAALAAAHRRSLTLREAVARFIEVRGSEFTSAKHRKQWVAAVERLVGDALGDLQVDAIDMRDVLKALEPHWHVRTDTAKRVRQRLERIFDWATVAGHREGPNPAAWKGGLAELLPAPGKVAKGSHQPALKLADSASWWAALRQREGTAARALEFLALTWARSGEVRGATWEEFDLDAGLWVVPAERMKAAREHRVPLPTPAVELLRGLPRFPESPYVFAAVRGGALSDMSISAVMRRMHAGKAAQDVAAGIPDGDAGWRDARSGRPAVPHGLRSTARDWAAEHGYDHVLAEIALGHSVGSEVERAYRRTDMLERRRAMLAAWADFLCGKQRGEVVVPISGGRSQ